MVLRGRDNALFQRLSTAADLRYAVLSLLHQAFQSAGISREALAERLQVNVREVDKIYQGDGNITIAQLGEYAHELGFTVRLELVPRDD